MTIPNALQVVLDAQDQATKDRLAEQLEDPAAPPVLLCCKSDTEGNEVCITVDSAGECPGSASLKSCTHGQSNTDGTATCHDNDPD